MDPSAITPYEQVLKDGFYEIDCVRDYMFEHGDKHGSGKFNYELESVAGVSIVHYADMVDSMDQEPMTHEVCFRFCRTVPDMGFFGITNGRKCYCAPYYQAMAGDSSSCDEVCDGASYTMCGGKSKSSIFQMHGCGDTKANVADGAARLESVKDALEASSLKLKEAAGKMQTLADEMQPGFGKAGDSTASSLLQNAKVFAGNLEASVDAADKVVEEMGTLEGQASSIAAGGDVTSSAEVTRAEELTASMESVTVRGEAGVTELEQFLGQATSESEAADGAASLYYPVMYFVDKDFKEDPSTCGGQSTQEPIVADFAGCEAACEAATGSCVGFSFVAKDASGLCFLMSELESVTYYTGCGSAAFLQAKGTSQTKCVAKMSEFQGTTLKPDPSGKCKKCLKTATKADRCFE
jgi:hypothetical protein